MIDLEVGQTYRKKATNRKMNTISNARSQWFGRYIEFTITDINGDNIEYRTLHPTWGEVTRVSTRNRFLKMIIPTITLHYRQHPLYKGLAQKEKLLLDSWMSRLKENLRSRELDEEFLTFVKGYPQEENLRTLYLNSDEEGNIMETAKSTKQPKEKVAKEGGSKEVYGKGAFRRWQKKGYLSEDKKQVTLSGVTYNITKEGSKYKLSK